MFAPGLRAQRSREGVELRGEGVRAHFDRGGILVLAARGRDRELCRVSSVSEESWKWELSREGEREIELRCEGMRARLFDDGLIRLGFLRDLRLRAEPLFEVERAFVRRRGQLHRDAEGGFGLWQPRGRGLGRRRLLDFRAGEELLLQGFPFREEDPRRCEQEIAHEGHPRIEGGLPREETVRAAARHCAIFTVHAWCYAERSRADRPAFGRDRFRSAPWRAPRYEAKDPEGFRRLRDRVRDAGMAFVPYFSPYYSRSENPLGEALRLMEHWEADGLYLDGLRGDLADAHQWIRALREAVGEEAILTINASDHPLDDPLLPQPFIEGHADFVLRGGRGRAGLELDAFLRDAVSQRGLSNAVGLWCHYGSSGGFLPRDRAPGDEAIAAAVANGVRIWRRAERWTPAEVVAFDARYFPARAEEERVRARRRR